MHIINNKRAGMEKRASIDIECSDGSVSITNIIHLND